MSITCFACNQDVDPRPPNHGYWALIVSFWVFSLLFGIGAAVSGWGFMLLVGWLLLATMTGMLVQRATAWTCPECGATVAPPIPVQPGASAKGAQLPACRPGAPEGSTRDGPAHADAQGIGSIGPRVGRVLAPGRGVRTAALALLVALAACGPMRGPSGPQRGEGLSVRQPLSPQTAVVVPNP